MNVQQLIDALQGMPADTRVTDPAGQEIESVTIGTRHVQFLPPVEIVVIIK